ncbi:MAG TPA: DMT family transporter [Polyangiaceae bacterium]|nr:DMT family transporter [Polyangiaceae bacterium]
MQDGHGDGTLRPVPTSGRGYLALFAGLVAMSTSAPFFVMAHVDAYAAVFWRTALTALLALGIGSLRGKLDLAELRRQARPIALGGVLLGAHFLAWVKAFDLTDYASNLLLLVFQPVMAAFLAARLGERLSRHVMAAVVLAVLGMALIAGGDFALSPRAILGDALCLAAGVGITVFYVVTSRARRALSMDVFLGAVMLVGAATALPVALAAGVPLWGYPTATWQWIGGIVVVTTLMGHGLMNYAANHVSLFTLNIVVVLEPAVGIAFGVLLFGATLTALQLFGGALLSAAVMVGLRRMPASQASAPPSSAAILP